MLRGGKVIVVRDVDFIFFQRLGFKPCSLARLSLAKF